LGFDKPVEPKSLQQAGVFNIKGFAISNVTFNTDARALQREVIIETNEKIVSGTKLKLHVNGVADRNFPPNYATRQEYTVVAKPGESQKGQFIDKWAILGPFPSARDKTLKEFASIINPVKLNAFSTVRPEAEWRTVESQIVDFGRLFGEISDQMAIAVTYVYSEKSRKARLRLDTNDHNRAWLNGKLINDGITGTTSMRGFHDFADEIDIKLKAGWNHCVVLVDNHLTAWLMSGQIVDENGVAIRDLTWQIRAP
jgi:hypothetical protein